MEDLYKEIFNRGMSPQEKIILRRLRKLYGEEMVIEAIRLSVAITEGSPVKYIVAVANNLHKESQTSTYGDLYEQTQSKLKDLEEMKKKWSK